jgi:thymidylate kinase
LKVLPGSKDKPPLIICLLGIDGSGKTTLGTLLVARLLQLGKTSRLLHYEYPNIGVPSVLRGLYRTENRILTSRSVMPNGARSLIRHLRFVVYAMFVLFDSLIFVARKFDRNLDVLILDRYYFDAFLGFVDVVDSNLLHLFSLILPRPDLLILFDVSGAVAARRKREASSAQSEERRVAYLYLLRKIKSIRIVTVKSEGTIKNVLEDVINHVHTNLPCLI